MRTNKTDNSTNFVEQEALEQPIHELSEFQLLLVGGGIGETCV
jgi:hypothetical protein